MIREGKHDSEMAIRLGLSTGELRERKQDLRNRLGDEQYYRLVAVAGRATRRRGKERLFLGVVGVLAGVLAVLLVVANVVVDDPAGEDDTTVAVEGDSPTATPGRRLRTPSVVTVEGVTYEDAGAFLVAGGTAAVDMASVENRPGQVMVTLPSTTFVSPSEFVDWDVTATRRNSYRMRGVLGERTIEVRLWAASQVTRLRELAEGVGPVIEVSSWPDASRAAIRLQVYADDGQQLPSRVTEDGRLLVGQSPFPADWVLDANTGARLSTGRATVLGTLESAGGRASAATMCSDVATAPRCTVLWFRSSGLVIGVAGSVRCTGANRITFEAEDVQVTISRRTVAANQPPLVCDPFDVPAGSRIVPEGDWEIEAATSSGGQVSVGVTTGGTLMLGPLGVY